MYMHTSVHACACRGLLLEFSASVFSNVHHWGHSFSSALQRASSMSTHVRAGSFVPTIWLCFCRSADALLAHHILTCTSPCALLHAMSWHAIAVALASQRLPRLLGKQPLQACYHYMH